MSETTTLHLRAPLEVARDAIVLTLSEQGFTVRPSAGGFEVERITVGPSAPEAARFRVSLSVSANEVSATFSVGASAKPGTARVMLAAARVAGVRLDERGLSSSADGAVGGSDANGVDVPEAPIAPAVPTAPLDGASPTEPVSSAAPAAPVEPGEPVDGASPAAAVADAASTPPRTEPLRSAADTGPSTLAIVALILGVVGTVMTVLLALVGVVGAAYVMPATVGSASTSTPGIPDDVTPAPAEPSSSTGAFVPSVGQCFVQRGHGEIGEGNLVACSDPHAYEVYARFALDEGGYPGDSVVADRAQAGCADAFTAFVGRLYADSVLEDVYLSPTPKAWARGDRWVTCLVTDPASTTTGSLHGAAR